MKQAVRVGIILGVCSFLFASYTAVTGPVMLPDRDEATRERMAKIQASMQVEPGGGCCGKKEESTAHANCSHAQKEQAGCAHGSEKSCPSRTQ